MKNKVIVFLFLIVSVLVLVFVGCRTKNLEIDNQKRSYSVRLLSEADGGSTDLGLESANGNTKFFRSPNAPNNVTITFAGKEYVGKYSESHQYSGTDVIVDQYEVTPYDPYGALYFEVNNKNQQLIFINFANKDFSSIDIKRPILAKNEIKDTAILWASEFVELNEYAVLEESIRDGKAVNPNVYCYRFCRMFKGIETTDLVDILITDRGTLVNMGMIHPGWTKDHEDELEAFSVEDATSQAIMQSGLTSPTVETRRFGLSESGEVFLMVCLCGRGNEAPVVLIVSAE